jgi:hypothetical protein
MARSLTDRRQEMTQVSRTRDKWLPLLLVLLAATLAGTLIVTIWPPFG